jgi:hypothetical protein
MTEPTSQARPSPSVGVGELREKMKADVRKALTEDWKDTFNLRSWSEDVLLTGCRNVGGGKGYQDPEHAADYMAGAVVDAILAALSSIPVGGLEVAAADAVAGGAANPHSASASPVADARRAVKRMDTFRHSLDRITRDAIADSLAEISTELERRYGPITEEQLREALSRPQELAQLPALPKTPSTPPSEAG